MNTPDQPSPSEPPELEIVDENGRAISPRNRKRRINFLKNNYPPIPIENHCMFEIPLDFIGPKLANCKMKFGALITRDGRVYFEQESRGGLLYLLYSEPDLAIREPTDPLEFFNFFMSIGAYDSKNDKITAIYLRPAEAVSAPGRKGYAESVKIFTERFMEQVEEDRRRGLFPKK